MSRVAVHPVQLSARISRSNRFVSRLEGSSPFLGISFPLWKHPYPAVVFKRERLQREPCARGIASDKAEPGEESMGRLQRVPESYGRMRAKVR